MKCSGEKDPKFVILLEYENLRSVVLLYFTFYFPCYHNFLLLNALVNVDIIDHGYSLARQIKYYVSTTYYVGRMKRKKIRGFQFSYSKDTLCLLFWSVSLENFIKSINLFFLNSRVYLCGLEVFLITYII